MCKLCDRHRPKPSWIKDGTDLWINEHGVTVHRFSSGHYGHNDPETGRWHDYNPIWVPDCCMDCKNLDRGEYGDYGDCLGGPICERFTWFPTAKGTCKWQEPYPPRNA